MPTAAKPKVATRWARRLHSMNIHNLSKLLNELQHEFEAVPMAAGDKLRALRALSGLASCLKARAETPEAFALVAELLALSERVPLAKTLLDHYPVLKPRPPAPPATGAGAR